MINRRASAGAATQKPSGIDEPVRLIQVGAGSMGRAWLATIRESTDAELVGVVDLDVEVATAAASAAGMGDVAIASSLSGLLGRVDADAVVNVTVPEAHREVSTIALLSGLAVLCEKPVAHTTSAALSMAAAAEVGGRLLMVSQSRRYTRTLDAFRGQIARLGVLGLAECTFFRGPRFAGFREQMPYPLLMDMAIHQFDLARDLLDDEPEWISCESFNPPWSWFNGDAAAQVSAGFAHGARFSFTGSWCSPGLETSWNGAWRVSGAEGTAVWDGDHDPRAETATGEALPANAGDGPEGIAGSLAEFVGALRSGAVPSGEVHANVMSLAMVESAIRSAQTGQRVAVADLLDRAYREALEAEQRDEVRDALAAWPDVRRAIGRRAPSARGGQSVPGPGPSTRR